MSTIHCRLAVLASSARWSDGRATLSEELPPTITTRLRHRTLSVHHRLSYAAASPAGTATPPSSRSPVEQPDVSTMPVALRHLDQMRPIDALAPHPSPLRRRR